MRSILPSRQLLLTLFFATSVACAAGSSGSEGETPSGDGGGDSASTDGGDLDGADDGGADGGDDSSGGEDTKPPEDTAPPEEAGEGGVIPGCGVDTDGDGITDAIEGRGAAGGDTDTDKDGTPDWKDDDSDGDGIPDVVEWATAGCPSTIDDLNDADGDGIPNFQDTDSDGNGLPDKDEACPPAAMLTKLGFPSCVPAKPYDFDGDGVPDYLDFDNDHDSSKADKSLGLLDLRELQDNKGTYVGLVDTDGDEIPDLYDRDSDGDFILDLDDGISDPDGDGKPSFRDLDSDGDKVPDACEARAKASPGAGDLTSPLLDTDMDGTPDYVDVDSDGDLLVDGNEDKNGNCIVDADETDRLKADTDGDGVSDLVEVTLIGVTGAKDATKTPAKAGKFYFLVPWSMDGSALPSPTASTLALSTTLNKGDVGFVIDTTGSMGGEITNLRTSLSSTIIPALKTKIPDLGIGIAAHDDYPYYSCGFFSCSFDYGDSAYGDLPYYDVASPKGFVTSVTADSQAAANALTTHGGDDNPESQLHAYYRALTGAALVWPGGSVPAVTPPAGTFGALRFRSDAFPILIGITDISHHNGKRALNKTGTSYDGAYQYTYTSGVSTYNADDVVGKLTALGAKFIGVSSDDGTRGMGIDDPYGYLAYLTDKSNSNVPPSAFPGGACKTGVGGATVAADGPGGTCRSVYSINTTGSGLSTSIVDGVYALLASIKFDTYVEAYNGAGEPIDVVDSFMEKVEPQPTGGTDPVTGTACVTFPASQLADARHSPKALAGAGDIKETILQVNPGNYYCFSVTPKPNTTVKPTTAPQTFRAWLKVNAVKPAGGTFTLGSDREVLFIVPPVLN
ncbi:MAG: hypothetical protein ACXWUG_02175 [Polyangiales bacterium]